MEDNNTDVRLISMEKLFRGVKVSQVVMRTAVCHPWLSGTMVMRVWVF